MLPPTALPRLPRRPALRPGLHVVRRDQRHLQVGLDPPGRVIVVDEPGVRDLINALRCHTTPALETPESRAALRALVAAGLVLDQARQAPEALEAQYGADAHRRHSAHERALVGLRCDPASREPTTALLAAAGLRAADPDAGDDSAPVWLVVAHGELGRGSVDDLLRRGIPHLVVSGNAHRLRVGPLVVPGATACLRCLDAHLLEQDPRRPLLVEQAARAVEAGAREPIDPVLSTLGLALAVRDLARFVEGDRPATYSATITVEALAMPHREQWGRHPHCGCAWDQITYA